MRFFFFNDTATTEIYTLSLHDALPISWQSLLSNSEKPGRIIARSHQVVILSFLAITCERAIIRPDRKSTRLNSSHQIISYAVFCLKKKSGTAGQASKHSSDRLTSTPRR